MAVVTVLTIAVAIFSEGPKNKLQRWLYIGLFAGIPLKFILGSYLNSQLLNWLYVLRTNYGSR